ncbi:hypothetical protein QTI66_30060 [Variovorax sp. J22R133]|uniref:hypothetical protein n=1 Tax=Variovorax brevis TaxID=3053503 RepID=UPI0025767BC7|nr:hypothetical protein [Variovorax sp. J22R133]MDM0116396.1 hypothetical protein [Variovorax sp. J22R133]
MKKPIIAAALTAACLFAQAGIVGVTLQSHAIGDYMAFCPQGWGGTTAGDQQRVTCVLSLPSLELAFMHLTGNKVSDIDFYLPDRTTFDAALEDVNRQFGQATINPNKNGVFWRPGDVLIEAEQVRQRYQISVKRGR